MRQLFLIALLALIVFLQINGEKIPVNDGAFGDGVFYREVGQTFLESIEEQGYNLIQLTRILPFAFLNLSFSAFHIVKDFDGMRNGMIIWQVVFLGLSVYWYFRICNKLRLKVPVMTLGFILLFFNFTWLKEFWYHPFSPDGAAFALGMGQANYYLRYEKFKLGLFTILGVFVSPLLLISGMLMLLLPGDKLVFYPETRPKSAVPLVIALIIPVFLATMGWGIWGWRTAPWYSQISYAIALLALIPLSVGVAIQNPIDWEASQKMLKKRTRIEKLNKGIMGLAAVLMILVLLSGNNDPLGIGSLAREIGAGLFRFPLDFILGFGLQWGLGILLTALYLNRFAEELGKQGWAPVIIIMLGMIFLPFFSPLTLAAWVPLWIVILLKAIKRYRWGNKDLIIQGSIALLLSFCWLKINSPQLADWLASSGSTDSSGFEIQKLAFHWEAYRSWASYLVCLLGFALISYFLQLRRKRYQRVLTG